MQLYGQDQFAKFEFEEIIGTEYDDSGNPVYDEALLKKVNSISLTTCLPPLQGSREPRNPTK